MLSYRKLAMRVLGRPLHTGGIDSPRPASQRAAAFILTAAMLITLAAPAFADIWHIENGDISVKASGTKGKNTVSQGNKKDVEDTNTIITGTSDKNTVTIDTSKGNVDVTFDDLNIDASSRNEAAMSVTGSGNTTIKLDGDNHLTGGNGSSGIDSNGSLTIYGGENDSLTVKGGSGADGSEGRKEKRRRGEEGRRVCFQTQKGVFDCWRDRPAAGHAAGAAAILFLHLRRRRVQHCRVLLSL